MENTTSHTHSPTQHHLAFIFSGIGAQWTSMGAELFKTEAVFRQTIEACDRIFSRYSDWSLSAELSKDAADSRVEHSLIAHPCNFAIQAALVALLRQWGITPQAVVGHSAGEVVAAYTAGALTLDDALHVIWQHCVLMEEVIGKGGMAHVSLGSEDVGSLINDDADQMCIAAVNSPQATVLSGDVHLLDQIVTSLQDREIFCRRLNIDIPFHTPQIEPFRATFQHAISTMTTHPAVIPVYSSLHGTRATVTDFDAAYWSQHIRQPVLFAAAIQAMLRDGYTTFLEIGAHPVLSGSLHECVQAENIEHCVISHTFKRGEPEKEELLKSLTRMHVAGYPVQWQLLSAADHARADILLNELKQDADASQTPWRATLHQASSSARQHMLLNLILDTVAVVSEEPVSVNDTQTGFLEMGLTSLAAITLKERLSVALHMPLSSTLMFDYPNIQALADYLESRLLGTEPPTHVAARHVAQPVIENEHEPIAVVGMSCRFPGGANSPQQYWDLLKHGADAVCDIPRDRFDIDEFYDPDPDAPGKMITRSGAFLQDVDLDAFDAKFFGISPGEARHLDPQQRLLLEVTYEAFEDAAMPLDSLQGSQVGVFVGICCNDFSSTVLFSDINRINVYSATGSLFSCAAGRLSYVFKLKGPCFPVDTACSSSLVALDTACKHLRAHTADAAVVAGVNLLLNPHLFIYFSKLGAISPDGRCKTFDASANGYGRGEGCGVLIVKRLSDAQRDHDRILAVVRGTAVNHDGPSSSFTAPNGTAQQEVIHQALADAGLSPEEIGYIEAHGTGTALGDPIEINALGAVYGKSHTPRHPLIVGSAKASIGHLEGAAGIAGVMKTILALNHAAIPPQTHFKVPNPHIDWDNLPIKIATDLTPWEGHTPRIAGVNAFGFSGTNAHVILEEAPAAVSWEEPRDACLREHDDRPAHLLTLSAKTPDALQELALKYREYLNSTEDTLPDICYTANTGRTHFGERLAVFAASKEELAARLGQSTPLPRLNLKDVNTPVFLFPGQGSQYPGMGQELYATQPVFRHALERCNTLFQTAIGASIIEIMYAHTDAEHLLNQTRYTQPAIFSVEYALLELWRSWGIEPGVVVGHSIGEYVAACAAGVFSLEDAVTLVSARARLMQSLRAEGMMAAIFASEDLVRQALQGYEAEVSVAAINAPGSLVISGARAAIESILADLTTREIDSRILKVSHAFHSPLMEPILPQFRATAATIAYNTPQLPLISNLSGALVSEAEPLDADYWTRHIRETVRFNDTMNSLRHAGCHVFLEAGAQPILTALGRRCLTQSATTPLLWLPSLKQGAQNWQTLLSTLGTLYEHGAVLDWTSFDAPYPRRKIWLPTYPFQRRKYTITPGETPGASRQPRQHDHPFIGQKIESPLLNDTVIFQSVFNAQHPDFLQEHVIYGALISPAAAHISMVLSAVKILFDTCRCCLEHVNFLQPLLVHHADERTVQLIIDKRSSERMPFRIISRKDGQEAWSEHCTGSIRMEMDAQTASRPTLDKDDILSRCHTQFSGAAFHQQFRQAGYELGTHFQCLEQGWYAEGETLSTLKPAASSTMYEIHPGTIDAIWQTIIAASTEILDELITQNHILIPLTLSQFRCYSTNVTQTIQTHSRCRPQDGFVDGDTTVWNEDGELLLDIKEIIVRETNKDALFRELKGDRWTHSQYAVEWLPQELEETGMRPNRQGPSLIFADHKGYAQAFTQVCQDKNIDVVHIHPATVFTQTAHNNFSLNPASLDDFHDLFSVIRRQAFNAPLNIIFFWPLNSEFDDEMTCPQLEEGLKMCCEGLLNLIKSMASIQWETSPRLWLITQHAHQICADETIHLPQSALSGVSRTILLEHPEFWGSHIDLDDHVSPEHIDMLFREIEHGISATTADHQMALRHGGRRYVPRLQRSKILPGPPQELALNPDACYWILGGLGALGLLTAEHLIHKGARHLVLSGRSQPKPEAQQRIHDFQSQGVHVSVQQLDVADANHLSAAWRDLSEKLPPVKGIIHAAGTLDVDLLTSQTWARFRQLFAAKALGAWNLHRLTQHMSLDFFLFFSSVSALVGDRGQGHYAGANAFLDGLARYRRARGLPGTSVNWGPWAAGMAASDILVEELIQKRGYDMLQPAEGMRLLEKIIVEQPVQTGFMNCDFKQFLASMRIGRRSAFFSHLVTAGPEKREQEESPHRLPIVTEILNASAGECIPLLITYLCHTAGQVIGCEPCPQPEDDRSLIAFGLDSLMAVEMRNMIKQDINVNVPLPTLMQDANISALAHVIAGQLTQKRGGKEDMTHDNHWIEGEL